MGNTTPKVPRLPFTSVEMNRQYCTVWTSYSELGLVSEVPGSTLSLGTVHFVSLPSSRPCGAASHQVVLSLFPIVGFCYVGYRLPFSTGGVGTRKAYWVRWLHVIRTQGEITLWKCAKIPSTGQNQVQQIDRTVVDASLEDITAISSGSYFTVCMHLSLFESKCRSNQCSSVNLMCLVIGPWTLLVPYDTHHRKMTWLINL